MVSNSAMVCKSWNYGTNHYRYYVDVRDMIPWQSYRGTSRDFFSLHDLK